MGFRKNVIRVWSKIQKNKEAQYRAKADQTRQHSARLSDMQRYVDMSKEKRRELIKVLKSQSDDKTVLEKGALVYTRLLEVAETLQEDITKAFPECTCYLITSKQTGKKREKIVKEFREDSSNKVIIISEAGGESVSLQTTNELIMYNIPRGPGKWAQIIGRVARMFSKYDEFNIHFITVEESIDEYSQILLSAKKELEEEILSADTIPLKGEKVFNNNLLKKVRAGLLWRHGLRKKNPKVS